MLGNIPAPWSICSADDRCFEINLLGGLKLIQRQLLVGGLERESYFSIQLGMSSSQLTNSNLFQTGRLKPPARFYNVI